MSVQRRVVVCGSSRLAPEIAAVAVRIAGNESVRISVPDFTSEQPTNAQVDLWHNCILNADEVVVVCDGTYTFGDHVRSEIYTAHMGGIPVRLVNGELESK